MKKRLSAILLVAALCLALAACGSAPAANTPSASAPADSSTKSEAAAWPTGDVTVYVPAGAGGGTDTLTRLYTERLKAITGANFIVVNDTTGANSVAYETVRNAKPDGLTLMSYHGGICAQYASGQYAHSLDEFTVLGSQTTPDNVGYGIWVSGKSDFQTFDDLISYAKDHPGELVAGVEVNNTDHMLEAMLAKQFGIEMAVVSAGSNAEKIPLLMGGNLDVCFFNPVGTSDYHTSGDLRCLAILGSDSTPLLEGVPTFTELGYEPLLIPMFAFFAGPQGMSDDVCKAIDDAMREVLSDQSFVDQVVTMGYGMDGYVTLEDTQAAAHLMQSANTEGYSILNP